MKKVEGYDVDLTADEARAVLEAITPEQTRTVMNKWQDEELHILYQGQWHHLCRTDLKDDVCTFGGEESLKRYRDAIYFGARVGWYDGKPVPEGEFPRFAIIDHWSDG